eukprot:5099537-Alexandrium_andersonii.AAC.1
MKKATLADVPMPFAAHDMVISVQKIGRRQDSDAVCSAPWGILTWPVLASMGLRVCKCCPGAT